MIELSINEKVLSVPLTVSVDPRWDVSKADLQNQFDIANQVIKLINESQKKLNEMRQIITQIKSYITLTKEKEFNNDIKQLLKLFANILILTCVNGQCTRHL